jgi:hypothetical protein
MFPLQRTGTHLVYIYTYIYIYIYIYISYALHSLDCNLVDGPNSDCDMDEGLKPKVRKNTESI